MELAAICDRIGELSRPPARKASSSRLADKTIAKEIAPR